MKGGTNMEKRIKQLKDITKIQCSKGNYDIDEYMRGMANGLILAEANMEDKDPQYLEHNKKDFGTKQEYCTCNIPQMLNTCPICKKLIK